jgi:hypothetical protein
VPGRTSLVLAVSALAVAAPAATASAVNGWGEVQCDQSPHPGCELHAGRGGETGGAPGGRPRPDGGAGGPEADGRGDRIVGGGDDLAHCDYERSDYRPLPDLAERVSTAALEGGAGLAVRPAVVRPRSRGPAPPLQPAAVPAPGERFARRPVRPAPGERGAWYVYRCSTPGVRDALYRPPVWIPDAAPAAPVPSAAQLAERARSQLRLPSPAIRANPAADQIVGLPTWMWLDRAGWAPVSATASVPGVSVTAVARPVSAVWSTGDGARVTCAGPGSPFPAGADPADASPDCGHTYRSSSAGRPGDAYPVTVAVRWEVAWAGAGQAGTAADLTTASTAAFRVAEVHALATTTGGG